jgi:hypothetical protein
VGRIVGYGPISADAPTPSADNRTFFADLAGTNPFLQTSAGQAEKVGFEFGPLRQRPSGPFRTLTFSACQCSNVTMSADTHLVCPTFPQIFRHSVLLKPNLRVVSSGH